MTPQQRHDLANVAQAVFWAIEQNKPADAMAELEIFFDEILAAHTKATNDICERLAKAHAELDDIRKALGLESGAPIVPAIQAPPAQMSTPIGMLTVDSTGMRTLVDAFVGTREKLAAAVQNGDANLEALTRCRALIGSVESKFWSDTYLAVAGCFNAQKTEVAERWADAALAAYKKRFSP